MSSHLGRASKALAIHILGLAKNAIGRMIGGIGTPTGADAPV